MLGYTDFQQISLVPHRRKLQAIETHMYYHRLKFKKIDIYYELNYPINNFKKSSYI